MRIPYANIPAQAHRISSSPPSPAAEKSLNKRQILEPQDNYNRSGRQSSAQVIDAEYVEFYTPSTKVFSKERQDLDISLEAEAARDKTAAKEQKIGDSAINSYHAIKADPPPPPGTYINIFA